MTSRLVRPLLAAFAAASALTCSPDSRLHGDLSAEPDETAVALAQHEPLGESLQQSGAIPAPDVARSLPEPGVLPMVATVPAAGWSGPGGAAFEVARRTADPNTAHSRRFGAVTLPLALRDERRTVSQFPCTSCHLGRAMRLADDRVADAHANIAAVHPTETGGVCSTCHAPDDVELLTLKRGERATLDHAYRLCAQCHVGQVEAWAGGAHGKRLDGWQGRRVLMGCADCHDPHDPTLEPRIPFRAPQLQRTGGH